MKKHALSSLLIIGSFLLVSCGSENTSDTRYIDKSVHIYRRANSVDKNFILRFYTNQPNVPYVEVNNYFKEFFDSSFLVDYEDSFYKYYNLYGYYLGFDVKNQTFSSDYLDVFNNHPDFGVTTGKNYLKVTKTTNFDPQERVISLKNYHIPIYEDHARVYVPFTFLSKFAGGSALYNIAYNGKDIYVIDRAGQLGTPIDYRKFGDAYYSELNDLSKPRPLDLAQYSYNELCFVWDNLRGYTSQLLIGDDSLISIGLDRTIERLSPKLKQYLLSTDKNQYYQGYYTLLCALYDGGHTNDLANFSAYSQEMKNTAKNVEEFNPIISQSTQLRLVKEAMGLYHSKIKRDKNLGYDNLAGITDYYYYDDTYKTSYIGFDEFKFDFTGWDNYYKGSGPVPTSTDTYAFVRSKLYQAKSDGAENIVLDISSNGGGAVASLLGLVGLFNDGKAYYNSGDAFNKFKAHEEYAIDINLDGAWNALDKQELDQFNFNIGVLTTEYSFSCGNLFPAMMKEIGYKIMGARSGGGSCAISYESTAEGIPYVRSSQTYVSANNGENVDAGIAVDFEIEKMPSTLPAPFTDLTYSSEKFFDAAITGSYLSSAYTL